MDRELDHAFKSQVAINLFTGEFVGISQSERGPTDAIYSTMIASCRIVVEHRIPRSRWYEPLKQVDRQHRENPTARVVSGAGLVNRQIRHELRKAPS
jgi:hypothetical protein